MKLDLEHMEKAIARHLRARNAAWVSSPYRLYDDANAPEVVHLTPERHIALVLSGNQFFCGGMNPDNTPGAVLQMLYFISPAWNAKNPPTIDEWLKTQPELDGDQCFIALFEWIETQFANSPDFCYESPGQKQKEEKPDRENVSAYVDYITKPLKNQHFAGYYVRFFQQHFGWEPERTLSTPYPRLHQLEWAIISENNNQGRVAMYACDTYKTALLNALNEKET